MLDVWINFESFWRLSTLSSRGTSTNASKHAAEMRVCQGGLPSLTSRMVKISFHHFKWMSWFSWVFLFDRLVCSVQHHPGISSRIFFQVPKNGATRTLRIPKAQLFWGWESFSLLRFFAREQGDFKVKPNQKPKTNTSGLRTIPSSFVKKLLAAPKDQSLAWSRLAYQLDQLHQPPASS